MVLDTVTEAQKEFHIAWNAAKELTARKNITKEFTIVFYETQFFVIRNSELAGPGRSASKWTFWHRRITPTAYPEMNFRDIKDSGISH